MRYAQYMLFRLLPLIVAIVPLIGVTAAYWLGVRAGVLPDCIPYLDGCTSISATGRYMPGSLPFRAALFPQAAFLIFLWWSAAAWLRAYGHTRYTIPMQVAGIVGGIALIIYVTFLGTKTEFYEIMRRFGIYLYFLGIVVAQVLFTLAIHPSKIRTAMIAVVLAPWIFGIGNLIQKALITTPNNIENRAEWIVALLMQIWFFLLYLLWRREGIVVRVSQH